MNLAELNSLSDLKAREEFLKVCGSREWARAMEDARPFDSLEDAQDAARECWNNLTPENRLEAFAAHPRIGDRSGSAWSKQEQGGVSGDEALRLLTEANRAYEARFKHVFLICATGKAAPEILAALQRRMSNTPEEEFAIASAEQAKIIRLRMEKLIQP